MKFRRKTFFQATGTRVVLFVTRTISLPKQRELLCLSELRLEFDSKEIMKLTREGKESGRNFVAKTSSIGITLPLSKLDTDIFLPSSRSKIVSSYVKKVLLYFPSERPPELLMYISNPKRSLVLNVL